MHATSFDNMRKCLERFVEADFLTAKRRTICEIGAQNINGSYRPLFASVDADYVGIDMAAGPGVDIVVDDPYRLPFESGSVDLVLSGQMLEHSEFFWIAFQEMARILSSDGYLILIAPSAGPIHRYPVDCYRFYPDAYRALAKLTQTCLVAIWLDERGPWRDLVGIFSKDPAKANRPPRQEAIFTQNAGPFAATAEPPSDPSREPYLETLNRLHENLQPNLYFEIGVRSGGSLALASCPSVAIDPDPAPNFSLSHDCSLYRMSSDEFFETQTDVFRDQAPDLVFIDGMHLFEYALRDFMNVEKISHSGTCVVVDDIFPTCPEQADRKRNTAYWTGDVWKLVPCLERFRPDLRLIKLDTYPTGLLLIVGCKKNNRALWDQYNPIMSQFSNQAMPVHLRKALDRVDAHSPRDLRFTAFLCEIRSARGARNALQRITMSSQNFLSGS